MLPRSSSGETRNHTFKVFCHKSIIICTRLPTTTVDTALISVDRNAALYLADWASPSISKGTPLLELVLATSLRFRIHDNMAVIVIKVKVKTETDLGNLGEYLDVGNVGNGNQEGISSWYKNNSRLTRMYLSISRNIACQNSWRRSPPCWIQESSTPDVSSVNV